jgi:5'-nucleotidase
MRTFRLLVLALAVLLLLPALAAAKPNAKEVEVQLLGLNDFHGHLESTTPGTIAETPTSPRVPAGGAEYLATHLRAKEAENKNTLIVSAGDLIGASPLLSALFHDEPTIEAMNQIGLDLNAVGNHEFDEGADELRRMQRGGCHPVDGCQDGTGFEGADFRFLAANVVRETSGRTLFRPYSIKRFKGVKVGFIGMTLEGTPDIAAYRVRSWTSSSAPPRGSTCSSPVTPMRPTTARSTVGRLRARAPSGVCSPRST